MAAILSAGGPSKQAPSPLQIHRARFIPYTPSSITSIAFPPPPFGSPSVGAATTTAGFDGGLMGVAKGDGRIEIHRWVSGGSTGWILYKILTPPRKTSVDTIAFTLRDSYLFKYSKNSQSKPELEDLRLFSCGGGDELLEWDLEGGRGILRSLPSHSGPIWSFAPAPSSSTLALACSDGSLRLISLAGGALEHSGRIIPASGGSGGSKGIVSVCWGLAEPITKPGNTNTKKVDATMADSDEDSNEEDEDEETEYEENVLYTGHSDSSVRKWDRKTGRVVDRMLVDKIRGSRTVVWALAVLPNRTVVAADSLGSVTLFSPTTNTQLQVLKPHSADILSLAVSSTGTRFYTSGVDQKTCEYSLAPSGGKWIVSGSKRMHTHDVKSLAVYPPYSPIATASTPFGIDELLVSGGLDTSLIITPCSAPTAVPTNPSKDEEKNVLKTHGGATFVDGHHRKIPFMQDRVIYFASSSRLIVLKEDKGVSVWKMKKLPSTDEEEDAMDDDEEDENEVGGYEKLLKMELNFKSMVVTVAVSADGEWLAASDVWETKLWKLEEGGRKPIRVKSLTSTIISGCPHLPLAKSGTGASNLIFSPDGGKLVLTTQQRGDVIVLDISTVSLSLGVGASMLRVFSSSGSGAKEEKMEVDDDDEDQDDEVVTGKGSESVVALGISPDGQWLAVARLNGGGEVYNFDSLRRHCLLPTFPQRASSLSFHPLSPHTLFLGFPNNTFQIYDIELKRLAPWAVDLCNSIPPSLAHLPDPMLGIIFDPCSKIPLNPTPGQGKAKTSLMFAYGSTWVCRVRLDDKSLAAGTTKSKRKRRKSKGDADGVAHPPVVRDLAAQYADNFKVTSKYRPILGLDFVKSEAGVGELVVVERPFFDFVADLPAAYARVGKYGS